MRSRTKRFITLAAVGIFLIGSGTALVGELRARLQSAPDDAEKKARPDPNAPRGVVLPFPELSGMVRNTDYEVMVDGVPVLVYRAGSRLNFCQFAMAGIVQVTVSFPNQERIAGFDLSPHSSGVSSSTDANAIEFQLDRPRKLILQGVNGSREILTILADAPEVDAPVLGSPGVVSILDQSIEESVQHAVDSLQEGEILYFPPGLYETGALSLKSDTSLYLAPGAVLRASPDRREYSGASGIISLHAGERNVRIFGRGILDGSGTSLRDLDTEEGQLPLIWTEARSSRLQVEGIVELNAPIWNNMLYGNNHSFRNVKILGDDEIPNRDGIDAIGSLDLRVDDCLIVTGDDCLAINPIQSNAYRSIVRNSILYNTASGRNVYMGYAGNASGFEYENLDFLLGTPHPNIYLQAGIGTELSGITFRGIRVQQTDSSFLSIDSKATDHYGQADGSVKDIELVNIQQAGRGSNNVALTAPFEKNRVQDIVFADYRIGNRLILDDADAGMTRGDFVTDVRYVAEGLPEVNVSATAPYACLGEAGISNARFTVHRTGSLEKSLTVLLAADGTAKAGVDYKEIPQSLTIPAGAASADLEIIPVKSMDFGTVQVSVVPSSGQYIPGPDWFAAACLVKELPVVSDRICLESGTPMLDGAASIEELWTATTPIRFREAAGFDRTYSATMRMMWDDGHLFVLCRATGSMLYAQDLVLTLRMAGASPSDAPLSFRIPFGDATEDEYTSRAVLTRDYCQIETSIPIAGLENGIRRDIEVALSRKDGQDLSWGGIPTVGTSAISFGTMILKESTVGVGSKTVIDGCRQANAGKGTPKIDGMSDAIWDDATEIFADRLKSGSVQDTGIASGNRFRILWDDLNLYVLAEILDDSLLDASAPTSWEKDSIEIFLDEMNRHTNYRPTDGTHIRIDIDGKRYGEIPEPDGVVASVVRNPGGEPGYSVEILIPFRLLKPIANDVVGFDVQVNDASDGRRQAIFGWSDSEDRASGTASVLGQLVLQE